MDRLALQKVLRLAGLLFIPLSVLAGLVIGFLYYDHAQTSRTLLQLRQEKAVELGQGAFASQIAELAADVSYLADGEALRHWLAGGTPDDLHSLERELMTFARHKIEYDQVRFIDLSGQEIVRADHALGRLSLTPPDALQNRADRFYVSDTLKMNGGEISFSRFDLNVEQGRIEQPIKPVIRVATPAYDASGQKRGVLVLNYAGQRILTRMRVLGARAGTETWLVDEEGYWMLGPTPDDEWAFMFPARSNRTIAEAFPAAWQRMSEDPSGKFADGDSLFAYTTIVANTATLGAPGAGEAPSRKWYLVSHASAAALPTILTARFLLGCAVMVALLVLLCFVAASYKVRREQSRDEIDLLNRRLAHSEKMEALGQLTGGVAHDFNNLLAVIIGNAEILAEQVEDPELKSMAEQVVSSAEDGSALTERLLAIGRRQALHPVTLEIDEVMESLEATLFSTLGSGIALEVSAAKDQRISVDRSQFESALVNLALNARAAMPDGGVFRIRSEIVHAPRALADDLAPGRYVKVTASDTGIGMSAEVAEHVFDPFFTTKEIGKGAGMGLAMVYGFAKQSGGHAVVESWSGHGSAVHLYLPLAQKRASAPAVESAGPIAAPAGPVVGGKEKVLMVEDEPQLRDHISRQLSDLGYAVIEAESGVEALAILNANPDFDILFTDIVMPGGVNGIDLAEQARQLRPQLKVLLTTGYADAPASKRAAIEDPILRKPYKRQHLAQAIREALDRAA
jgi:signal transduction histidine kinase/CheY-like chemotaxis protein